MLARCLILVALLASGCEAGDFPKTEPELSKQIATERGLDPATACEVRTPDGSRCDIVTAEYAYEVEWATKWKEAPAQAVLYGMALNRKPAVILLMRNPAAEKDEYLRCLAVCRAIRVNGQPIRVEVYKVEE